MQPLRPEGNVKSEPVKKELTDMLTVILSGACRGQKRVLIPNLPEQMEALLQKEQYKPLIRSHFPVHPDYQLIVSLGGTLSYFFQETQRDISAMRYVDEDSPETGDVYLYPAHARIGDAALHLKISMSLKDFIYLQKLGSQLQKKTDNE